jgi:hypothetical protein
MIWQNWFDILFLSVGNTNPTARTGNAVERLLRSKTEGDIGGHIPHLDPLTPMPLSIIISVQQV